MYLTWIDAKGNLYEAVIHDEGYVKRIRLKMWDKKGRVAVNSGAHTTLMNATCPPAKYPRASETLMSLCLRYGCPPEKLFRSSGEN